MSNDPWEIADELDELVGSWDPDADNEVPTIALQENSWRRKRLLALRFARAELADTAADFEREAEILATRRTAVVGRLETTVSVLENQLTSYHRAVVDAAKRFGKKIPVSMATAHGSFLSRAPSVKATVAIAPGATEADAALWLVKNGYPDAVRPKPAVPASLAVDKVKARSGIQWDDDGELIGVVAADGTVCPYLVVTEGARKFSIETEE